DASADVRTTDTHRCRAAVGVDSTALHADAPVLLRSIATGGLRSVEQHAGRVRGLAIGVARALVSDEHDAGRRRDLQVAREMARALARDGTMEVALGTEIDAGVGSGIERYRVRAPLRGNEPRVVTGPSCIVRGAATASVVS